MRKKSKPKRMEVNKKAKTVARRAKPKKRPKKAAKLPSPASGLLSQAMKSYIEFERLLDPARPISIGDVARHSGGTVVINNRPAPRPVADDIVFKQSAPVGGVARQTGGTVVINNEPSNPMTMQSLATLVQQTPSLSALVQRSLSELMDDQRKRQMERGVGQRKQLMDLEGNAIKCDDNDQECVICAENKRDILFEPCNHIIVCIECARRLNDDPKCPKCRKTIESAKKVFLE